MYADEFNEALHRARRTFFQEEGVPREQLRQLYNEFAEMLVRIEREAGQGIITAERAEALSRSIMQEFARFGVRLEEVLINGTNEAANAAAAAHEEALRRASRAAGVRISHSFASVPTRALENMMMRRGIDIISDRGRGGPGRGGLSGTFETLVRRRIRNLQPEVDRVLTSAVARGQSAGRLAKEMALTMSRDDPGLSLALERIGARGQRLNRLLHEGKFDEITDIPEIRHLLYDARRISVSEINNAHFESDRLASSESPVVDLLKFEVSGRHAGLHSSPDVCDVCANQKTQYGIGLYHPSVCPSLLHPHCGCSTSKVLLRPAQWGDPSRPIPPLRLVDDEEMRRILGNDASEAFLRGQQKMMNDKLRAAHSVVLDAVAA